MSACIIGWSHTPFGRHEGADVEALIDRVVGAALADKRVDQALPFGDLLDLVEQDVDTSLGRERGGQVVM